MVAILLSIQTFVFLINWEQEREGVRGVKITGKNNKNSSSPSDTLTVLLGKEMYKSCTVYVVIEILVQL